MKTSIASLDRLTIALRHWETASAKLWSLRERINEVSPKITLDLCLEAVSMWQSQAQSVSFAKERKQRPEIRGAEGSWSWGSPFQKGGKYTVKEYHKSVEISSWVYWVLGSMCIKWNSTKPGKRSDQRVVSWTTQSSQKVKKWLCTNQPKWRLPVIP